MFEEIKTRPCIIEWIGESHILFHGSGFLPIAVFGDGVAYLTVHSTFDAAKAELVKWLDEMNTWLDWLHKEDLEHYSETQEGEE